MTDPALDRMAARASDDPFFLGHLLNRYAEFHRLDDAALADRLGCPPAQLATVRLCRAPRVDAAGFRADVDSVAGRFGLNRDALIEAARYGQVTLKPADPEAVGPEVLLAARDRTPEDAR